mmetsp:Transcript_51758/g.146577  ORF Transcript_51758/g.146577 Transcript_51758/m.146577 type:complete len:87 (-) Transcript_51758:292-552(-)
MCGLFKKSHSVASTLIEAKLMHMHHNHKNQKVFRGRTKMTESINGRMNAKSNVWPFEGQETFHKTTTREVAVLRRQMNVTSKASIT